MASLIDIVPLMFLLFTTFYYFGEARIIEVGGSLDAWKVPESPNHTLSHWAESVRFQVGDALCTDLIISSKITLLTFFLLVLNILIYMLASSIK